MKYAIITPTYQAHFNYIKRYLESYAKYVIDRNEIDLFFTISKAEEKVFAKITAPYKNKVRFRTLIIEDILGNYGVTLSSESLLNRYKKFTYQTLKKYYSMLYVNANRYLILDSESMWIRESRMLDVFAEYFEKPFITFSDISKRWETASLITNITHNINYIFNKFKERNERCGLKSEGIENIWTLENFVWYYDNNILHDMFADLGNPLYLAETIQEIQEDSIKESGIFEINLYHAYIISHNDRYHYNLINADHLLEYTLSSPELHHRYLKQFYKIFKGNCGLLENVFPLLTLDNHRELAHAFRTHNFNIIRGEIFNFRKNELHWAKEFLDIAQPNILAASQCHFFGVNALPYNRFRLLLQENKYYLRLSAHWKLLVTPFFNSTGQNKAMYIYRAKVLIWIIQPLAILLNVFKLAIYMLKKTSIIFKN